MSLDGVIQAPGHAGEDPDGFGHGGWSQPHFADHARHMPSSFASADALLLGRSTYDQFAAHWPTVTDPGDEVARALNELPKHVVTTRPVDPRWGPTEALVGDDLPAVVGDLLDRMDGEVLVVGSARLASTLIALDLIDVYRLWIRPVVLGSGKRLLPPRPRPIDLRLTDSHVTPSGVAILTYARARATAAVGPA